jgi:type IV fimbrial biogenesis protein FimT
MKDRSRGFTLMELMLVIALAAIILAIGAPNFNEFRRNSRLTGAANNFLGAIQTARTEAIKRQVSVSICPSDNAEAGDAATCNADGLFRGWIVFVDPNSDCGRDPGEEIVRGETRIEGEASGLFAASTGTCISFAPTGFRQTGGGKLVAEHTVFCDSRGNVPQAGQAQSSARGVEVTRTGRARVTREVDEIEGWDLECGA